MKRILENLPGHNCGACGFARCDEFSAAVRAGKLHVSECAVLRQERYEPNRIRIEEIIRSAAERAVPERAESVQAARSADRAASITAASPTAAPAPSAPAPAGLIDGYEADFILAPLDGEAACREILLSLTPGDIGMGDVIRYRPLGCPIVHFARIAEKKDGLLTVHVVGPRHRLGDEEFRFTEIGLCMVSGFEGTVRGGLPSVGQTVRFLPAECMMQKVHSAVVVSCEGRTVRLECLDLKVWAPPLRAPPMRV